MKDNFNNKPLEEFFHTHLDPLEEDPGADFWEGLEPMIPPSPKKRRRLLFWWWGLGLVVLGLALGGYLWQKGSRINRLSEKVTQQQLQIDALVEERALDAQGKNNREVDRNDAVTGEDARAQREGAVAADEKVLKEIIKENQEEQEKVNAKGWNPLKEGTNANSEKQGQLKTIINADSFAIKSVATGEELPPAAISTLTVDSSALAIRMVAIEEKVTQEKRPSLFQFDQLAQLPISEELEAGEKEVYAFDSIVIVSEFEPLFDIGIHYEQSFLAGIRSFEDASFLFRDNFSFQGRNLGLDVGLRIGEKWRLTTGIGWAKMIQETDNFGVVAYSSIDRFVDEDWVYNNYDYDVTTVLGTTNYSAEIGIQFRDDIDEGIRIDFQFLAREELDYLYLPLHLSYQIGKEKWGLNAGLGLDYYYLLKVGVKALDTERIFAGGTVTIRNIQVSNESRLVGLNNSFWGARASLGFTFRPAEKWQFHMSTAYQYDWSGITNFSKGGEQALKAHLDLLQFRLGVFYEF